MKCRLRFVREAVLLAGLLLFSNATWAGGPVGHFDTLDPLVKEPVTRALESEGYFYPPPLADAGSRSFLLKAFLWDHRYRIPNNKEMPQEREVDTAICLLIKKGYTEEFRRMNRRGKLDSLCE